MLPAISIRPGSTFAAGAFFRGGLALSGVSLGLRGWGSVDRFDGFRRRTYTAGAAGMAIFTLAAIGTGAAIG